MLAVVGKCGDVEPVPGGIVRWADQHGVDLGRFGPALSAAINANIGSAYDRSALIPEVTAYFREVADEVWLPMSRKQAETCREWSQTLIEAELLRKKP
jgi:hypothetical protein